MSVFFGPQSQTKTIVIFLAACVPYSMSGEIPDTIQISGNELKVLKVDESVNTTFVCEARNSLGSTREQVTATVRGESDKHNTEQQNTACA